VGLKGQYLEVQALFPEAELPQLQKAAVKDLHSPPGRIASTPKKRMRGLQSVHLEKYRTYLSPLAELDNIVWVKGAGVEERKPLNCSYSLARLVCAAIYGRARKISHGTELPAQSRGRCFAVG